jgi:hypothetical protein
MSRSRDFRSARIALLACAALTCGSAMAASDKKAEEIGALYIGATLNKDGAQAKKLNDILRPDFEGNDALDAASIADADRLLAMAISASFVKPEPTKTPLKKSADEFSRQLVGAAQKVTCTVKGSAVRAADDAKAGKIATVQFECMVPDIDAPVAAALKSLPANGKLAAADFDKLAAIYAGTSTRHAVAISMDLYSGGAPDRWSTGTADDATQPVMSALIEPLRTIMQ